jgi:hypothetical protein
VSTFLSCVEAIRKEIDTADSLLFEEIEKKVKDREAFVTEQSEKLKEMDEKHMSLKDHLEVLVKAQRL